MADIGFRLLGDNSNFRGMIDSSQGALTKFSGAMSQLGVGLSAVAVVGFFKNITEKAGALDDLSNRLFVGTDALQAWDLAARMAGADTAQATRSWERATKAVDELMSGNASAAKSFAVLGLSAQDFVGLNMEQSLEKIARGYRANADAAGAYDAMTDLLGTRSAPRLNAALLQLGEEGFESFIQKARESGHLIESDTIRQLDHLGDTVTLTKEKITTAGATLMGWVLTFGEGVGTIAANMLNKFQGLDVVPLEESAKRAAKALGEVVPQQETLTAEGKKQILQELEKSRLGDEQLSREERLALLKADLGTIEEQLAKTGLSQFETDGLRLMQAETKKLIKADEKVLDTEAQKHAERMEDMTKKEIEDKRSLLTTEEQIAELKNDEAGWMAVLADQGIESGVRQNAEYELAKTRQELRPLEVAAEQERLAVLNSQQSVLVQQLQTAKAITTEVNRTGKGYDQQSDTSLSGVQNRLESQIQKLKRESFGQSWGVGGTGTTPELYLLENELFNLQKETDQRQEVRDYASRFGETRARQEFGDTLTDRALRDFSDQQTATRIATEDIQQRLALYFPKT